MDQEGPVKAKKAKIDEDQVSTAPRLDCSSVLNGTKIFKRHLLCCSISEWWLRLCTERKSEESENVSGFRTERRVGHTSRSLKSFQGWWILVSC